MSPWTQSDWLTAFRISVDIVVLGVIGVGVYWVRRVARKIKEERELVRGLLATVKGWTVVNVGTLEKHTQDVKDTVPEATAEKVVEKLKASDSIPDSGQMPVWKPGDTDRRSPAKG